MNNYLVLKFVKCGLISGQAKGHSVEPSKSDLVPLRK